MAEEEDKGTKLQAPADFDGPTANRSCTDVLFTLLMIAMWGGLTYIGAYAFEHGDYKVVIGPMDYEGNICGHTFNGTDMTDYPNLYYVNAIGSGVCVKECPKFDNVSRSVDPYTLVTFDGIFQPGSTAGLSLLPADFIEVANYSASDLVHVCTDATCSVDGDDPEKMFDSDGMAGGYGYAFFAVDSVSYFGRCVWTKSALVEISNITNDALGGGFSDAASFAGEFWSDAYGDVYKAWHYVLGMGFGATVVVSFLYMYLIRAPCLTELVVWGSIFLSIAAVIGTGYFFYDFAEQWKNNDPVVHTDGQIRGAQITSYVLFGVGGLLLCIICALRKQIQLAIGCVEEAAGAVKDMPIILFFPVIQAVGLLLFMIIWVTYAVFLAGAGTVDVSTYVNPLNSDLNLSYRSFEYDQFTSRCGWYLIFAFLWTANFILAIGQIAVSMAFAKWYFTRDRSSIGSSTATGQICAAFRYHIGTAAFGSLILAIVQFIQIVLNYIKRKAKAADNKIAQTVLSCMQCCLCCLEKCIRFMNKNAYIQTAIFGENFCKSAREAFFLILRNAARIGAISYVSMGIVFIGKLFIVSVITFGSYVLMNEYIEEDLNSVYGPLLVIFLMAWFISDMFMDVFQMGISTILHCFIADEEMFSGDQCFAQGQLKDWIDQYDSKSEKVLAK
mmetsp:Transcript_14136/g.17326  ORF Transcript_14136/g.17326 Transcript_14136/m.17326 type:complete len:669 (+) Transcript_14136:64-2070(+)